MFMKNCSLFLICILTVAIFSSLAFSNEHVTNGHVNHNYTIEFFASNNTGEIDLQTAFSRMQDEPQENLQNNIIDLMQKEHIEQGRMNDLLGTYQMSSDQKITADNSEKFITSPYQDLSCEKIFDLATTLANTLKQESVAIFIPKEAASGQILLKLKSHPYTIKEAINKIQQRLPSQYNQAFSLHLKRNPASFDSSVVNEIEWLGSNINKNEVMKSFPCEETQYREGVAYLIFKNGQRQKL